MKAKKIKKEVCYKHNLIKDFKGKWIHMNKEQHTFLCNVMIDHISFEVVPCRVCKNHENKV